MAVGKVTITVNELGGAPFSFRNAGLMAMVGQAERGTPNLKYFKTSFGDAYGVFGVGKLIDAFEDYKKVNGERALLVRAADDATPTTGDIVKDTAATGTATVAAAATSAPKAKADYVIEIINGGDIGVGTDVTYKLSADGGQSWGPPQVWPSGAGPVDLELPNGAILTFTTGGAPDFVAADTYYVSTLGPACATADILAALNVVKYDNDIRGLYIVDESTASEISSFSTIIDWMLTQTRPIFEIVECKNYDTFYDESFIAANVVLGGPAAGPPFVPGGTIDGTPQSRERIVMLIVLGGALGTATYRMSTDGGVTYGDVTLLPLSGEVMLANGCLATFAVGVYVAADTYTFGFFKDEWLAEVVPEYAALTHYRTAVVGAGFKFGDRNAAVVDRNAAGFLTGMRSYLGNKFWRSVGSVQWGIIPGMLDCYPGQGDGVELGDTALADTLDDGRLVSTRNWPGYGFVISRDITMASIASNYQRIPYLAVCNEAYRAQYNIGVKIVELDYTADDAPVIWAWLNEPIKRLIDMGALEGGSVEFDPTQDVAGTGVFKATTYLNFRDIILDFELEIAVEV